MQYPGKIKNLQEVGRDAARLGIPACKGNHQIDESHANIRMSYIQRDRTGLPGTHLQLRLEVMRSDCPERKELLSLRAVLACSLMAYVLDDKPHLLLSVDISDSHLPAPPS